MEIDVSVLLLCEKWWEYYYVKKEGKVKYYRTVKYVPFLKRYTESDVCLPL